MFSCENVLVSAAERIKISPFGDLTMRTVLKWNRLPQEIRRLLSLSQTHRKAFRETLEKDFDGRLCQVIFKILPTQRSFTAKALSTPRL